MNYKEALQLLIDKRYIMGAYLQKLKELKERNSPIEEYEPLFAKLEKVAEAIIVVTKKWE